MAQFIRQLIVRITGNFVFWGIATSSLFEVGSITGMSSNNRHNPSIAHLRNLGKQSQPIKTMCNTMQHS
jgi:hypothetical protein